MGSIDLDQLENEYSSQMLSTLAPRHFVDWAPGGVSVSVYAEDEDEQNFTLWKGLPSAGVANVNMRGLLTDDDAGDALSAAMRETCMSPSRSPVKHANFGLKVEAGAGEEDEPTAMGSPASVVGLRLGEEEPKFAPTSAKQEFTEWTPSRNTFALPRSLVDVQ